VSARCGGSALLETEPPRGISRMQAGTIEYEFGIPIPGVILPEVQWVRTALKRLPERGPLEWSAIFGRTAPVVLDLGCGNGRYTLLSALARPDLNHCAIDVLPLVIRYATRRANQRGLSNVRFAVKDAETFLSVYVSEASVAEVHLYHPQPYSGASGRQARRRMVTPSFLADVHRVLEPWGRFYLQTDNPEYWGYMTEVLPHFFQFEPREEPWPDAPEGRTRREIVARARGLRIFRGVGQRRQDLTAEQRRTLAETLPQPRFRLHRSSHDLDHWERLHP